MVINKEPNTISSLPPTPIKTMTRVSIEITQQLQRESPDEFKGIGCFNGMFSLQLKPGSKPQQVPQDVWYMYCKSLLKRS